MPHQSTQGCSRPYAPSGIPDNGPGHENPYHPQIRDTRRGCGLLLTLGKDASTSDLTRRTAALSTMPIRVDQPDRSRSVHGNNSPRTSRFQRAGGALVSSASLKTVKDASGKVVGYTQFVFSSVGSTKVSCSTCIPDVGLRSTSG